MKAAALAKLQQVNAAKAAAAALSAQAADAAAADGAPEPLPLTLPGTTGDTAGATAAEVGVLCCDSAFMSSALSAQTGHRACERQTFSSRQHPQHATHLPLCMLGCCFVLIAHQAGHECCACQPTNHLSHPSCAPLLSHVSVRSPAAPRQQALEWPRVMWRHATRTSSQRPTSSSRRWRRTPAQGCYSSR